MRSIESINQELNSTLESVPGVLHGGAIRIKGSGITDMNQLFFKVQEGFDQLVQQLQETKVLPETSGEDSMMSFLTYGFPRTVPGLSALEVVFIYIERIGQSFSVRFHFDFEGGSRISYVTTFITG